MADSLVPEGYRSFVPTFPGQLRFFTQSPYCEGSRIFGAYLGIIYISGNPRLLYLSYVFLKEIRHIPKSKFSSVQRYHRYSGKRATAFRYKMATAIHIPVKMSHSCRCFFQLYFSLYFFSTNIKICITQISIV